MKTKKISMILAVGLAIVIAFVLAGAVLPATEAKADPGVTYYVNINTGDDSRTPEQAKNSGTPWKTITHAVGQASAGDTIIVAKGNYT